MIKFLKAIALLTVLFGGAIFFYSCSLKYPVMASIKGLGNDSVLVVVAPYGKADFNRDDVYTYDIVAKNGKFFIDTLPDVPVSIRIDLRWYNMEPGEEYSDYFGNILLTLDPGDKVIVKGEMKDNHVAYRVKGSPDNDATGRLLVETIPYRVEYNTIRKEGYVYYDQPASPERDSAIVGVHRRLAEVARKQAAPYVAFIEQNLDSEAAAMMFDEILASPDDFLRLYPMLSERIRTGPVGIQIQPYYDRMVIGRELQKKRDRIADGDTVPDFTLETIDGKGFTLSAVEKEYTLIDFWSDGCSPCLEEMPVIAEYYRKYGDRIEFVSVGCLVTEATWRHTIDKYGMVWTQAMDDTDDSVLLKYNVTEFPTKFLIDNERRKVVAYMGVGMEFWRDLDNLMKR